MFAKLMLIFASCLTVFAGETGGTFTVPAGTHIPLLMSNSVSTKNSAEGTRLYLETSFPILAGGRIVIPPVSYVTGTITSAKRAGRVKGRAEMYLRFDSLILPNGTVRDFRARVGAVDGRLPQTLDQDEGRIKGDGSKGDDARTIGEAAGGGASIGVIAGSASGHPGMGTGIGAAAGATAGLMTVLLTRGNDIELGRGSTVEMVLDRDLVFSEADIDFSNAQRRSTIDGSVLPSSPAKRKGVLPGNRLSPNYLN